MLLSWSPPHWSFHFSSCLSHLSLRLSTVSYFPSYLHSIPCMYLSRYVWPLLPPWFLSTCLVLSGELPYPQLSPCPPSMVESLSTRTMPWHGPNHTFPGKRHSCSRAKVWAEGIQKDSGSFHTQDSEAELCGSDWRAVCHNSRVGGI